MKTHLSSKHQIDITKAKYAFSFLFFCFMICNSLIFRLTEPAEGPKAVKRILDFFSPLEMATMPDFTEAERLNLYDLLVCASIESLLPPIIFDRPAMRALLTALSRGMWNPPHRTKVTSLIDEAYERKKEEVIALLTDAKSIALTTDAAKLSTGDSYVTVTAHAIVNWKLVSACLGVAVSNVSHTAAEIATVLKKFAASFVLENRIDCIGSDNAANFKAAVEDLIANGVSKDQVLCACHTLQLSVKNALEKPNSKVSSLVHEFRDVVNEIANVPMLLATLKAKVDNPDLTFFFEENKEAEQYDDEKKVDPIAIYDDQATRRGLSLIKDIVTRWNSTLFMLQRVIQLMDAVKFVLIQGNRQHLSPSDRSWQAAHQICLILKPFQVATTYFEGEKYPTLGSVSYFIEMLMNGLEGDAPPLSWGFDGVESWIQLSEEVQEVRNFIRADMINRWDPANQLLCMAAVVDPRFKSLSWLAAEEKAAIVQCLKEELEDEASRVGVEEEAPQAKRRAIAREEKEILRYFGNAAAMNEGAARSIEEEVAEYLAAPQCQHFQSNPLTWWARNEKSFPRIAVLALRYLAIPASTAPSERVFSHAKLITDRKRHAILPERLHKQLFLRMNRDL